MAADAVVTGEIVVVPYGVDGSGNKRQKRPQFQGNNGQYHHADASINDNETADG